MKFIIGLGNPGEQYENTRHNVGFLMLDKIQEEYNLPEFTEKSKFFSLLSEGMIEGDKILLIKPQTFMNLSGKAAQSLVQFYDVNLQDILIVHDDVDLELGTYKHTESSRSAGQRGVQNIIDTIGTQDFPRLRVGIGPVPEHIGTHDFVLQKFSKEELDKLEMAKSKAIPEIINYK